MPEYTPPEVQSIMGLVETYLRWKQLQEADRGYEMYHPSAFGKCLRRMQYQRYASRGLIKTEPEAFAGKQLRLFANGHAMHDRWKDYFQELGVLKGVWRCKNRLCKLWNDKGKLSSTFEVEITANAQCILNDQSQYAPRAYGKEELQGVFEPEQCVCGCKEFNYEEVAVHSDELNFHGHCDMILDFDGFDPSLLEKVKVGKIEKFFNSDKLPKGPVVIDMKTINSISFGKLKSTGASKEYQIQLTIYINILKCDYGILIYEDKDKFDTAAYKIEKNGDAFELVRRQATLMNDMASGTRPLLPPPRPISKSNWECDKCEFKHMCQKMGGIWDDPNLEQKRNEFYGDLL